MTIANLRERLCSGNQREALEVAETLSRAIATAQRYKGDLDFNGQYSVYELIREWSLDGRDFESVAETLHEMLTQMLWAEAHTEGRVLCSTDYPCPQHIDTKKRKEADECPQARG